MASDAVAWELSGDYFENCNCKVVCPCLFSPNAPLTSKPTEGGCDVAFAFHIERGRYGGTSLNGLNVAMVMSSPGAMGEGNMRQALYVDDRADADQRAAVEAIFNGEAGGVLAAFNGLITTRLGTRQVAIHYTRQGNRREVSVPGVMQMAVHGLPSIFGPEVVQTVAGAHPFNPSGIALAVGEDGMQYTDHGMRWDNSGRNGHFCDIAWSNA